MSLMLMTANRQEGQEALSFYDVPTLEALKDLIRIFQETEADQGHQLLELRFKDGDKEFTLSSGARKMKSEEGCGG